MSGASPTTFKEEGKFHPAPSSDAEKMEALAGLMEAEDDYFRKINITLGAFIHPLMRKKTRWSFTKKETQSLQSFFVHFENLVKLHRNIATDMNQDPAQYLAVIKKFVPFFKIYVPYGKEFKAANKIIQTKRNKSAKFKNLITKLRAETRVDLLEAFHSAFTRIAVLQEDLVGLEILKDDPDVKWLIEKNGALQEELRSSQEPAELGLIEVHKTIKGSPFVHVIQPHRKYSIQKNFAKYLRQGEFDTPQGKRVWYALYNDLLIWTDKMRKYKGHLRLPDVLVEEPESIFKGKQCFYYCTLSHEREPKPTPVMASSSLVSRRARRTMQNQRLQKPKRSYGKDFTFYSENSQEIEELFSELEDAVEWAHKNVKRNAVEKRESMHAKRSRPHPESPASSSKQRALDPNALLKFQDELKKRESSVTEKASTTEEESSTPKKLSRSIFQKKSPRENTGTDSGTTFEAKSMSIEQSLRSSGKNSSKTQLPLSPISNTALSIARYVPRQVLSRLLQQDEVFSWKDDDGTDSPMSTTDGKDLFSLLPDEKGEVSVLHGCAVMIADISGFTKLNERMRQSMGQKGAEAVSIHINSYFTKILAICNAFGGDCVKFAGDALIILFSREALEGRATAENAPKKGWFGGTKLARPTSLVSPNNKTPTRAAFSPIAEEAAKAAAEQQLKSGVRKSFSPGSSPNSRRNTLLSRSRAGSRTSSPELPKRRTSIVDVVLSPLRRRSSISTPSESASFSPKLESMTENLPQQAPQTREHASTTGSRPSVSSPSSSCSLSSPCIPASTHGSRPNLFASASYSRPSFTKIPSSSSSSKSPSSSSKIFITGGAAFEQNASLPDPSSVNQGSRPEDEEAKLIRQGLDPSVDTHVRDPLRAVQAALELQLNAGSYKADNDIELTLHIAIGVGTVYAWHVGGYAGEWEFLISGAPFAQLNQCLDLAGTREVVCSKQCWRLVKKFCTGEAVLDQSNKKTGATKLLKVVKPLAPVPVPPLPKKVRNVESLELGLRAYVSRCVLDKVDVKQGEWTDELRKATVTFVNLAGLQLDYTIPPKKVQAQCRGLQFVLSAMQTIISRNQGYRRQFLVDDKGTVLIVVFGVPPYAHEDDAFRALKTALELREVLLEAGVKHSIGVATGNLYVGSVGSSLRKEHAVVGDTVNLSARLSGKAAKEEATYGNILLDTVTASVIKSQVKLKDAGKIKVKGKSEEIPIFVPASFDSQSLDKANFSANFSRSTALVGRKNEVAHFSQALVKLLSQDIAVSASSGKKDKTSSSSKHIEGSTGSVARGHLMYLEGTSGMGKTHLARQFYVLADTQSSAARRVATFYCAADVTKQATSLLSIWRSLLEQLVGLAASGTAHDFLRNEEGFGSKKQKQLLERDQAKRTKVVVKFVKSISHGKHIDPRVPLLNLLLNTQIPPSTLTKQIVEDEDAIILYLKSLIPYIVRRWMEVQKIPLVLIMEDIHLLDEASQEVLVELCQCTRVLPLLLILTARPVTGNQRLNNALWCQTATKLKAWQQNASGPLTSPVSTSSSSPSFNRSTSLLNSSPASDLLSFDTIAVVEDGDEAEEDIEVQQQQGAGGGVSTAIVGDAYIKLVGFDEASMERFVAQQMGIKTLPPGLVQVVNAKSGGNPLYAQEVATHLLNAGIVNVSTDGSASVDEAKLNTLDLLPSSLQSLVTLKIDKLPLKQTLICKLAATFGEECDLRFLRLLYLKESEGKKLQKKEPPSKRSHLGLTPDSDGEDEWETPLSPVSSTSTLGPGLKAQAAQLVHQRQLLDELDESLLSLVRQGILSTRFETYKLMDTHVDNENDTISTDSQTGSTPEEASYGRREIYFFNQTIIRRACYKLLLYSQRSRLHFSIAEILEVHNNDDPENADLLTYHFSQALALSGGLDSAVEAQVKTKTASSKDVFTTPGSTTTRLPVNQDAPALPRSVGRSLDEKQKEVLQLLDENEQQKRIEKKDVPETKTVVPSGEKKEEPSVQEGEKKAVMSNGGGADGAHKKRGHRRNPTYLASHQEMKARQYLRNRTAVSQAVQMWEKAATTEKEKANPRFYRNRSSTTTTQPSSASSTDSLIKGGRKTPPRRSISTSFASQQAYTLNSPIDSSKPVVDSSAPSQNASLDPPSPLPVTQALSEIFSPRLPTSPFSGDEREFKFTISPRSSKTEAAALVTSPKKESITSLPSLTVDCQTKRSSLTHPIILTTPQSSPQNKITKEEDTSPPIKASPVVRSPRSFVGSSSVTRNSVSGFCEHNQATAVCMICRLKADKLKASPTSTGTLTPTPLLPDTPKTESDTTIPSPVSERMKRFNKKGIPSAFKSSK